MRKTYSKIVKTWILIILLPLVVASAGTNESNCPQPVAERSNPVLFQQHKESTITKELFSRFDILLGFVLGLGSTCFVDYLRKRRQTKEFRRGMHSELKQILATMCTLSLNHDATITREKVNTWLSLSKEFDLHKEILPLLFANNNQYTEFTKKTLSESELNDFVALHSTIRGQRETEGKMQTLRKIDFVFIQNNISCISLMKDNERSNLFNILRHANVINIDISNLNFIFEKTYDESIHDENRTRLKSNYKVCCQDISDRSYEAAKEIAHLLRQ
ncbi:MAG: hypothetical protein ABSH16_09820 [Sedimentisphaerales bacterium]